MFNKTVIILTLFFVLLCGSAFAKATYGSVTSSKLNIYAKASSKSEVVGLLGRGSSVEILSTRSGWHKIKLLEGGTGYVKASGVRTSKDKPKETEEKAKTGDTGKDIDRILDKFNSTVEKSNFAKKEKVYPKLKLISAKGSQEVVLRYSAVDENGDEIPSLKKNPLAKNMRELISLIFRKMIVTSAPEYKITVMVPSYGMGGKVAGEAVYADLVMKPSAQELLEIKEGTTSLWTVVRSTRKLGDVFAEYPR
ncbi:SH3 domain-containing protein [Seleniivibrio woodruffii]|uniref:SH3 domain-containing protein n=1 Tax=Seleniivibrio woodruffii TaxID=1078050 RepID=UPI002409D1F4|nr:SH3 domain-containing protein [Seleniivibrio woodruffii]